MKTLEQALKGHKNTTAYAMAINKGGMIPDIGETVYNDAQTLACADLSVDLDGNIVVTFGNGQKVDGCQVAQMVADGIVKIK